MSQNEKLGNARWTDKVHADDRTPRDLQFAAGVPASGKMAKHFMMILRGDRRARPRASKPTLVKGLLQNGARKRG